MIELHTITRSHNHSIAIRASAVKELTVHHNRAFTLRTLDNFFAEAFRVETFLKRDEKVFHTGKSFVLGC